MTLRRSLIVAVVSFVVSFALSFALLNCEGTTAPHAKGMGFIKTAQQRE